MSVTINGTSLDIDSALSAASAALATAQANLQSQLGATFTVNFPLPDQPPMSTPAAAWSPGSSPTYTDTISNVDPVSDQATISQQTAIPAISNVTQFATDDLALPALPSTTESYNVIAETDAAIALAINAYINDLKNVVMPVIKTAPDISTNNSPLWNETAWNDIKDKLAIFVQNVTSADNVDTVVNNLSSDSTKMQSVIYAQNRERKLQTLQDAFTIANTVTGLSGFSMPNSMTTALQMSAQQNYMFDMSQISRDLIKIVFEWAKENFQFSIQQQIAAHNSDVEFTSRFTDVLIKVYEVEVNTQIAVFNASLAAEIAKLEGIIKEYNIRLQAFKDTASIQELKDKAKYGLADLTIKSAGLETEFLKLQSDVARMNTQNIVDIAKTNANISEVNNRNILETNKLNADILKTNLQNKIAIAQVNASISQTNTRNALENTANYIQVETLKLEGNKLVLNDARERDRIVAQNYAIQCSAAVNGTQQVLNNNMALMRERIGAATAAVQAAARLAEAQGATVIGVLNG